MTEGYNHRWSGWPGAYCLKCGSDDPIESALACPKCHVPGPDDKDQEMKLCPEHQEWVDAKCPVKGENDG